MSGKIILTILNEWKNRIHHFKWMEKLYRDHTLKVDITLLPNKVDIYHPPIFPLHRLSSRRCNFFRRGRCITKVYVFEKYSSRSLHFWYFWCVSHPLAPPVTGVKLAQNEISNLVRNVIDFSDFCSCMPRISALEVPQVVIDPKKHHQSTSLPTD